MKLSEYLSDRLFELCIRSTGCILLTVVLAMLGIDRGILAVFIIFWILLNGGLYGIDYRRRKKYDRLLVTTVEELDQKYLAAELIGEPQLAEYKSACRAMQLAMKSMHEEAGRAQRQTAEYREFIDQWLHGIKVPVTSTKLICENNRSETTRKILYQIEQIEADIDKVMYFARMEHVEQDYLIRKMDVKAVILAVLRKNKQLLILHDIRVETDNADGFVYSDPKWIEFIIQQIISNSVKYKKPGGSVIRFYLEHPAHRPVLCISDNGIGIPESDLPRIFQKGFTGNNGRTGKNSTGMGLYICSRLCGQLGVQLEAESVPGTSTTMKLTFPSGAEHL